MNAEALGKARSRIDEWREYVLSRGTATTDADARQQQLNDDAAKLAAGGLDADEALLIALRRIASSDEATRDFMRQHSGDLWVGTAEAGSPQESATGARKELWVALACAVAAAIAVKVPSLFGFRIEGAGGGFYLRNVSLLVLPFLAAYFVWKRRPGRTTVLAIGAVFAVAAVLANAFGFKPGGATEMLTAIHLPIVLWLAAGVAHAGGDWRSGTKRMEYIRFTGEWLITYALIALGGGVLIGITTGVFSAVNIDSARVIGQWVLPCGAAGAAIVAAWLVETRRGLVGGMAPMLARVFTPLFAVMLVALLVGVAWSRGVIDIQRDVLLLFDILLVLVLALLLYAISAREPLAKPGLADRIQLVLVVAALVVDVFALANIVARLAEFGFSANRTAVIGLNLILLVNLAWSAVLQVRALRSGSGSGALERWQTRYVPVYAVWSAIVVVVFPLLFGFV